MRSRKLAILILGIFAGSVSAAWAQDQSQPLPFGADVPGNHSSARLMAPPREGLLSTDTKNDHKANVFEIKGEVRILKHGSEQWIPLKKETTIEAGDQILTGKESYADVAYDSYFLNIARIEENTKADFLNIEPTMIRLEDGTIYNALDGLGKDDSYQIATPTAVAAVRGTHFAAIVDAEKNVSEFVTFSQNDGADHAILLNGVLEVGQDKSAKIELNQPLDSVLVQQASEESKAQFSECFSGWMNNQDVVQYRAAEVGTEPVKTDDRPQQDKSDSSKPAYDGNPPGGDQGNFQDHSSAADSFADKLLNEAPNLPQDSAMPPYDYRPADDKTADRPVTEASSMMNHPPDFYDHPPEDFQMYPYHPEDITKDAAQSNYQNTNGTYPYPPPPDGAHCPNYPYC